MRSVGQRDLRDLAAHLLYTGQGLIEDLADTWFDPNVVSDQLGRDPESKSLEIRPRGKGQLSLETNRGRIPRISALHRLEQQGCIGDRPGQRTALVERRSKRDHSVARDRTVGWLEADDPAERCRLTDGSSGVCAKRTGRKTTGDSGRRASRRTSRYTRSVPGVQHIAIGGVLVRRPHRELVHVGLAEQACARR